MEIRNTTRAPMRVPLPGGKRLHLPPGGSGQISPKASEHPPVAKLIEAGDIEVVAGGRTKGTGGAAGKTGQGSQGGPRTGGLRHTGDR